MFEPVFIDIGHGFGKAAAAAGDVVLQQAGEKLFQRADDGFHQIQAFDDVRFEFFALAAAGSDKIVQHLFQQLPHHARQLFFVGFGSG